MEAIPELGFIRPQTSPQLMHPGVEAIVASAFLTFYSKDTHPNVILTSSASSVLRL